MPELTTTWLGQSGFLIRAAGCSIACDLYLSDACKKRSKLDHTRLMTIPVAPGALTGIDIYIITHAHMDHFDPLTVGPLMVANPAMRILCPPSGGRIIDEFFPGERTRFELIRSGHDITLADAVRLIAIPAAHEELEKDATGEYIAFSYLLFFDTPRKTVFLAGDTIPYAGQGGVIRKALPEGYELTMVLPVNGRDEARAKLGFKGNLTLEEAVALYQECGATMLIPCHFGMFALNDLKAPPEPVFFTAHNCHAVIPEVLKPFSL